MCRTTIAIVALLTIGAASFVVAEEPLFPFVISYDSPDNASNMSRLFDRPAGAHGFVQNREGHLATDAGRIRFLGTNLCAEACFPTHEQAERLAARLARLGINCVRMHHMDNTAIWGDSPNKLVIDPKKLERLDYLVYQLKLHGVYTNLNLHVSRWLGEAEGFLNSEKLPDFEKGIDNFDPRMIELQKKYARDLLTHVNPYTKTAYTDEPAVAFVETSNEDALFAVWSWGQLDCLPDPYAMMFRERWNAWLSKKYETTDKLREVWGPGTTMTLGDEMLANGDFALPLGGAWQVERDDLTKADVSIRASTPQDGRLAFRMLLTDPGRATWNPQLYQRGLAIKKDAVYTLTFSVRSDSAQQCAVTCQMTHEPWKAYGLATKVESDPQWREHRLTFVATGDDPDARIIFSHFPREVAWELANVSFRPGGIVGLGPNDRLEDGSVPTVRRPYQPSPAASDFCDFLWDTEHAYWSEMRRFLKDDLHVRSLVSGTQLGYSPVHIQAEFDYLDNHAYWEHPTFPARPWDQKNWYVNDVPLVNSPGNTLAVLALARVAGKPYTVSEYNHPAPNSYGAEGFPMLTAFGAFQQWDGIYSFAYSHNERLEPQRIESFFDIKSHTAQLAHMPACAAMFVRGDVAPAARPVLFHLTREDERRKLHKVHTAWALSADELNRNPLYTLVRGTSLDLSDRHPNDSDDADTAAGLTDNDRFVSDTGEICWDVSQKDAGYYTVNTRRTKLFTGFVRGRTFSLGDVSLKIGATRLDWATVSMTAIDGESLDRPGRILIAATGLVQNQGAKLEQLGEKRVTLRDQWGNAPVLCEGIRATITLPVPADRVKCCPLDESGNRRTAIPVGKNDGRTQVELAPEHKTVWYEVEIAPPPAGNS